MTVLLCNPVNLWSSSLRKFNSLDVGVFETRKPNQRKVDPGLRLRCREVSEM